ncbi:MAG: ABC transporter permease [Candidatus Methanoplasma sp.]|jgi:ABC-2 type transport system permease protein|nr:ABC transporter permease [Candidatus Methanoplasma sp.]
MNHLVNLTKKELRELLTPGSIISVVVMVFIFMMVGTMVGGEMEGVTSPQKIGLVNGDDGGEWSEYAVDSMYDFYVKTYGITGEEAKEYIVMLDSSLYGDKEGISKAMIDLNLETALGIAGGFTQNINEQKQTLIEEYYIFSSAGLLGSASSTISSTIIPFVSSSISFKLVSEAVDPGDHNAGFLLNPVRGNSTNTYIKGEVYEGVTPIEISTSMMSQTMFMPLVIMIIIMMIGSIVISSMGNEKENKTLETLLTMPVKRTTIVSGKLLASAIAGLVFGLAYMIGMSFYISGFTGSGGINPADYGLSLGLTDWILVATVMFLAIFCALGLCMILGAFAKNYKAAQTMTLPIGVLAMIPMFVTMFTSWGALPGVLQAVMFAIPFSHPMMVMNNLMFGDITLVLAGLVYLLIFTAAVVMITVKLYKSDILLTGIGQTKAVKTAKLLVTRRKT